jgi:hypothetical protein
MMTSVMLAVLVLGSVPPQEDQPARGELRVYLADAEKNPIDLKDVTVTVIVEPKGGTRKTLKAELVSPAGEKKSAIGTRGEVRESGAFLVELAVKAAEADDGDAAPYFRAEKPEDAVYTAVIVFKVGGKSRNARGFEIPPPVFATFKEAFDKAEEHLKAVESMIKEGDLDKAHDRGHDIEGKLAGILSKLAPLAPEANRAATEKAAKELRDSFKELDRPFHDKDKETAVKVMAKIQSKLTELKKLGGLSSP